MKELSVGRWVGGSHYDEVDDATDYVPEGFTYIRISSEKISPAAAAVLNSTEKPPPGPTERALAGESPAYNDEYCLMETVAEGIVEPPERRGTAHFSPFGFSRPPLTRSPVSILEPLTTDV